jgi:putative hydrolase of the HAD superfamily
MVAMTEQTAPIRAVLFDLGGVVVDIDFDRALSAWARHSRLRLAQLRAAFRVDERYRQHETGRLSDEDFFAHIRQTLALDCDLKVVRDGWNALLVGEISETLRLVDAIRADVPRYAISNTNAAHVAQMEHAFPGLLSRFERVFVSHEIGHRKPDAAAFRHVLEAIGVPARNTLLFDDLAPNVEAAHACGMQAVQVRGPGDVRQALVERGLLKPSFS